VNVIAMVMMIVDVLVSAIPIFMPVAIRVVMAMRVPFDTGFARPATANRAHHSTSSSLTRISSPPVICN
jgi:hypothetical protein